ncbi:outer membrane autotransporter barrel domain-containing protein [Enhydrobacter aerosaccus]|uniref:Outer membrane autotransporter barrel domain-containing protein n=1 Tax=Enhydrobacter aerosaccus TaxID=225324 RepID=A0A1T4PMB4_9HYPH|nr:autotransporter outer membrane beta-barrel domain-containing protein [Enhydrobacter aerosaccus]SJZ92690.1 outer membrane autotransporter barrel domain-containing protein [Enhydrobacter aerosaccus]
MHLLKTLRRTCLLLALVATTLGPPALAQTGPLPPGIVVVGPVARGRTFPIGERGVAYPSVTNGIDANNYLGSLVTPTTLSFVNSASSGASAVMTTAPTQYIRFYAPGSSSQQGAFLVGSNQIRGMSAAQIRDFLALPFMPTMMTIVQLPAGTCLLVGTAGPIAGWGRGGAVQEYLIGKSTDGGCSSGVPAFTGTFINGQSIPSGALLYGPRAGGGNAASVAGALDRGPYPALYSGMDSLYNALDVVNYGDPSQLQFALRQLDGEVHVTTQSVLLGDSLYIREALLGRMRQASFTASSQSGGSALATGGPVLAYANAPDQGSATRRSDYGPGFDGKQDPALAETAPTPDIERRTTFWMQGVGAWGTNQGNSNVAGTYRSLGGFLAGVDRQITPNWFAGLAGGYTNSSVSVGDRLSASNIASAHVGGYTGASFGDLNVRAGLAASFNTVTSNRSIVFPGFADSLNAKYTSTTTQMFGEVGYGVAAGRIAAEPFAGLAFAHLDTAGFSESGTPGIAALTSSGNSVSVGFSTLGLRAATNFALTDSMTLSPRLSAAWQHAYGTVAPTATLSFAANGASFTTTALPMAQDSLLLQAGVSLLLNRQVALDVAYLGQLAYGIQDTWLTGRVSLRF